MSFQATKWAYDYIVPNLRDQVEKLVILRLADRANDDGFCWPSHRKTAEDLNVSVRAIQTAIKKLVELKVLVVDEKKGKVGTIHLQLQNVITIEPSKLKKAKKKTVRVVKGELASPLTGKASSPHGVKPDHPGGEAISLPRGEAVSPKSPSVESALNPPLEKEASKTVVVAEKKETGCGEKSPIIWPTWLAVEVQLVCTQLLDRVDQGRRQQLVDELAGAASMQSILSPPAWLRRIIVLDQAGSLILEHSASMAAARQARVANEARLLQISPPQPAHRKESKFTPSPAQLAEHEILKLKRLQWGFKPAAAQAEKDPTKITEPVK